MNKSTKNQPQTPEQLTEHQLTELESDAVWSLLEDAEKGSTVEASPMFARNVMREIRVNHGETQSSFWQRLMASKVAPKFTKVTLCLSAAACAVLIISQITDQNSHNDSDTAQTGTDQNTDIITFDDIISLEEPNEDSFTEEMLDLANKDPFFITEEELEIAMQM